MNTQIKLQNEKQALDICLELLKNRVLILDRYDSKTSLEIVDKMNPNKNIFVCYVEEYAECRIIQNGVFLFQKTVSETFFEKLKIILRNESNEIENEESIIEVILSQSRKCKIINIEHNHSCIALYFDESRNDMDSAYLIHFDSCVINFKPVLQIQVQIGLDTIFKKDVDDLDFWFDLPSKLELIEKQKKRKEKRIEQSKKNRKSMKYLRADTINGIVEVSESDYNDLQNDRKAIVQTGLNFCSFLQDIQLGEIYYAIVPQKYIDAIIEDGYTIQYLIQEID